MAEVIKCSRCANFKEQDAPQGICAVTKLHVLAWCGCTYDFVPRVEES